eukprot:c33065_g1_i1.p1 GENE.c33065_g1_i1~~c33065_g1_i1.p1  ORF type:complete len:310 (-),score=62.59 c33065_g1_i1:62-991(-)
MFRRLGSLRFPSLRSQAVLLGKACIAGAIISPFVSLAQIQPTLAKGPEPTRLPQSGEKLKGKIALITGAGSGIGKAAATALASEGCTLVLSGRRQDPLEALSAALKSEFGVETLVVLSDVQDPASVESLFNVVQTTFGRLDILFNNAGILPPGKLLEDLTFDEWTRVITTNLTGPFLCTQHAFRIMKSQSPQGGRIINNGSISADRPRPNSAPYTSAKHAMTGLTKSTILDGRKYNIACGQIDVGNARTEMMAKMSNGALQPNGQMMLEDMMDVKNVADAVLHMAQLPLEANISFMTVMATKMPLYGRG